MANEYSTLANLKLFLTVEASDTTRDTLLGIALEVASRSIDDYTGRRFYLDGAASARIFNPRRRQSFWSDGGTLEVDDIGSTTGLLVETGTVTIGGFGNAVDVTNEIDQYPENALARGLAVNRLLRPVGFISSPYDRIRVTARWGWPAVPPEVVQATLIQASRLFKRKDSPEGVLGSADWGAVRVSQMDPDVKALVHHLIVGGFA